jgi:hypothetical protein
MDTSNPKKMNLIREVIGGTPVEVGAKLVAAAVTILWAHLVSIAPAAYGYFILVVIDVILGATIAVRKGHKFQWLRLISGPAKKMLLTAGFLISATVVDTYVPGNAILFAASGYLIAAMFMDVASKYEVLSGNRVLGWIKERLGAWMRPNS